MDTSQDRRERRCPRLGGQVSFKYCRTVGEQSLPCWKISDCWWERFNIQAFLGRNYSQDELKRLQEAVPKPKLVSLVELIEQARRNLEHQKPE